jgi:hypothetical protein
VYQPYWRCYQILQASDVAVEVDVGDGDWCSRLQLHLINRLEAPSGIYSHCQQHAAAVIDVLAADALAPAAQLAPKGLHQTDQWEMAQIRSFLSNRQTDSVGPLI